MASTDRDIVEENRTLLAARAGFIRQGPPLSSLGRWGMTGDMARQIGALEQIQLDRAADCVVPLFGFEPIEDVVIAALQGPEPKASRERDSLDAMMEEEAYMVLINRWSSCSNSPRFAQTVLGLSKRLVDCLSSATLSDLRVAARRGVRLTSIVVRPQYFFHAGLNPVLQRTQRTNLAICNTRLPGY